MQALTLRLLLCHGVLIFLGFWILVGHLVQDDARLQAAWLRVHRVLGGTTIAIMVFWIAEILVRDPSLQREEAASISGWERALIRLIFWMDIGAWLCAVTAFTYVAYFRKRVAERMLMRRLQSISPEEVFSSEDLTPRGAEVAEVVCSICLEAVQSGDSVRRLACNHVMHAACVDGWCHHSAAAPSAGSVRCPVCRKPIA